MCCAFWEIIHWPFFDYLAAQELRLAHANCDAVQADFVPTIKAGGSQFSGRNHSIIGCENKFNQLHGRKTQASNTPMATKGKATIAANKYRTQIGFLRTRHFSAVVSNDHRTGPMNKVPITQLNKNNFRPNI